MNREEALRTEIDDAHRHIRELERERNRQTCELGDLRGGLERAEDALTAAEERAKAAETKLDEYERATERGESAEIMAAAKLRDEAIAIAEQAAEQATKLGARLAQLETARADFEKEARARCARLEEAQQRAEAQSVRQTLLEGLLAAVRGERDAARARLAEVEQELAKQWSSDQLSAEQTSFRDRIRSQLLIELGTALQDTQVEHDEARARCARLEEALTEARAAMANAPIIRRSDSAPFWTCLGCGRTDGAACAPGCWALRLDHAEARAALVLDALSESAPADQGSEPGADELSRLNEERDELRKATREAFAALSEPAAGAEQPVTDGESARVPVATDDYRRGLHDAVRRVQKAAGGGDDYGATLTKMFRELSSILDDALGRPVETAAGAEPRQPEATGKEPTDDDA